MSGAATPAAAAPGPGRGRAAPGIHVRTGAGLAADDAVVEFK